MTTTDRKVTRVTTKTYPTKTGVSGRGFGKPRAIAVTIMPGDVMGLRPIRTRQTVYISIEAVYRYAARLQALSERAQAINAKRRAKA